VSESETFPEFLKFSTLFSCKGCFQVLEAAAHGRRFKRRTHTTYGSCMGNEAASGAVEGAVVGASAAGAGLIAGAMAGSVVPGNSNP
jgi:hypothetical protein